MILGAALILLQGFNGWCEEIPVYCPDTKELLYYWDIDKAQCDPVYKHECVVEVRPEHFRGVDGVKNPSADDKFVCPGTSVPLNGFEYFYWKNDWAIVLNLDVYSLLTKKDGEFVWIPYSQEEMFNILGMK